MTTQAAQKIAFARVNIPAGTTTAAFTVPPGVGTVVVRAADPNTPGSTTLIDSSSVTQATIRTSQGQFGNYTGTAFFITRGGAYTVNVTEAIAQLTVYMQEG